MGHNPKRAPVRKAKQFGWDTSRERKKKRFLLIENPKRLWIPENWTTTEFRFFGVCFQYDKHEPNLTYLIA